MQNHEINTISVSNVLHTLRECNRNELYEGMFEHMLTFASELTGISEDTLVASMHDLPVACWKDVQSKYPMDREEMTEEEELRFVDDCFQLYEKEGFSPVYWSPFTDREERKGQPIEVMKRCTVEDCDLCALPMWKIKFSDGEVIHAYPEEIVPSEMRANGCRLFDGKKYSVDTLIQGAKYKVQDPLHPDLLQKERSGGNVL